MAFAAGFSVSAFLAFAAGFSVSAFLAFAAGSSVPAVESSAVAFSSSAAFLAASLIASRSGTMIIDRKRPSIRGGASTFAMSTRRSFTTSSWS